MSLMESTITVKGQTTLPKPIRDRLGLGAGDRLMYFLHPDGTVVLLPKKPAAVLRRARPPFAGKPVSLQTMKAAISAGATEQA